MEIGLKPPTRPPRKPRSAVGRDRNQVPVVLDSALGQDGLPPTAISLEPNKPALSSQFERNEATQVTDHGRRMSAVNEKIATMKQPVKKAKSFKSLIQCAICISIICLMCPYNLTCLLASYKLSKMVENRNGEGDYMSARSNSCIALVCILIALVFGAVSMLTVLIVCVVKIPELL